jgi:hypothetical protein
MYVILEVYQRGWEISLGSVKIPLIDYSSPVLRCVWGYTCFKLYSSKLTGLCILPWGTGRQWKFSYTKVSRSFTVGINTVYNPI